MLRIHCMCHQLALACSDTGDELSYIQEFEKTLLQLWKFFKNSPKRLKIYIKTALSMCNFDTLPAKRKTLSKESKRPAVHVGFLSMHLLMLFTKNMLVLSTVCIAFRSKTNLQVEQWHLDCWKRWIVWRSWAFSTPWNLCCHHWLLSAKHSNWCNQFL